jgi:nicotinate-nucleotide adenylyltransferase
MNIGLYFGSFNPIHVGHLIIATHILNETNLQKIWFVVSPQNPFKTSSSLLNEYDRFHLIQKAIGDNDRLRAVDIEFSLPKPSYTAHTLAYLKEKYPTHSFKIIMGSDSFQNLERWKNTEFIINNYPIIIYKRAGFEIDNRLNAQIEILEAPLLQISATHIRELIAAANQLNTWCRKMLRKKLSPVVFTKKIKANSLKAHRLLQ